MDQYYLNKGLLDQSVTVSELQLTQDSSHRTQHDTDKLQGKDITRLSDVMTNTVSDSGRSGLRLSLDCSHRRSDSRKSLNISDTDHDTSNCSDLRISEDTYHRRAHCNLSMNNSINDLDTASVCSDLKISTDTSHRRPYCRQSLNNSNGGLDTASVCSDLRISTETSHRSHHRHSLNNSTSGLDTTLVCSDLRMSTETSHRLHHRPSLNNSNSGLDTTSVCSDLRRSTDMSHRSHHRPSLNNSTSGLDTTSVCSDLRMSTDMSHRSHHRPSLNNSTSGLDTASVCSDLRMSTETSHRSHHRPSLNNSNSGLDTASVCSDLRVSTDTTHRSRNRQCLNNSTSGLDTTSVCSDLRISKDLSHRPRHQHSVDNSKHDLDTASVCSDLQISADISHRSLDISQHDVATVSPCSDLRVSVNMSQRRRQSNCEAKSDRQMIENKETSVRTTSNEHKTCKESHRIDAENSSCLKEVNSLERNSHISLHPARLEQSLGLTKSNDVSSDSRKTNLTGGSSRTRRKRFRSGSDSNVLLSGKRRLNTHRLNENETRSASETNEFLPIDGTATAQPTISGNIAKETRTEKNSTSAKQTAHKHLQGGTKIGGTASSISHRKSIKRRSWHGMDKKEKFIQKVHHSIARSDIGSGMPGIENKADCDKSLNVSKLETMMPLTEMCSDLERKGRHRFIRSNGILYRRLDNGGIWDKVLSKYVS